MSQSQNVDARSVRINGKNAYRETIEASNSPGIVYSNVRRDEIFNIDNSAGNRLAGHQPVNPLGTVGISDDLEGADRKVPHLAPQTKVVSSEPGGGGDISSKSGRFSVGIYKPKNPFQ